MKNEPTFLQKIRTRIIAWVHYSLPGTLIFLTYKSIKNEITPQDKKVKKLLSTKRGNTPLTEEEQKFLTIMNKRNSIMQKNQWRNEHL